MQNIKTKGVRRLHCYRTYHCKDWSEDHPQVFHEGRYTEAVHHL